MVHAAYLMAVLPLFGFVVLVAAGRRLGDPWAGWVGTAAVVGSFVVACVSLAGLLSEPASARHLSENYFSWITVGGLQVKVGLLLDPLSMTMCMFITGVSALIHLYSIGYMKGDPEYPKFFIYLNLFVFSMVTLVLANNLLVTFVGWEGVGVCSYFLVAFWHERDSAASAGKKAFIYNRIGDVGFLIAMFFIFSRVGTLDLPSVFAHRHLLGSGGATAVGLLLLLAATGKSAQIPLFNWLPDAMEGPTPVSALIHAATMVTAGVYLLCRISPILALTPDARWVVAIIGGVTAFVAATIATSQQDIKKVLAFSTVSQIGYMMLAVGTGAYIAAIFLMVAHAFYKGLLFLGAGSVIHSLHDEQDLKKMGALARVLPWTYATFLVGWLAIAGIPPLAGFWAKGDVLANVWQKSPALWALGVVTAVLTAYYMTRLFVLAFYGEARWQAAMGGHGTESPHESPWVMRGPLVVLAVLSFAGGLLALPWVHSTGLESWLGPVFSHTLFNAHESAATQTTLIIVDGVAGFVGLGVAWAAWRNRVSAPALEPAFLQRVWYWDDVYDAVIGRPGTAMARFAATVVDARIIDGAVNGIAVVVRRSASSLRRLQTGYVRNYALGIALGLAGVVAFLISPGVVVVNFPYLTVLVLLPAIGAVVVASMVRVPRVVVEAVGIAVALATLGFAIAVTVALHAGNGNYQFVSHHVWASSIGVSWFVGVDGISIFLVLMAAVLFPIALTGARSRTDARTFIAWMLLLEAACIGSFISLDLVLFFLFFELTLVPSYFIISGWGFDRRAYAAVKFFLYTFLGSAFLLVGIVVLAFLHQHQTGVLTFSLPVLEHTSVSGTTGVLLFLAFTAAFAVKAPLFPLHTWSPDAYTEAPAGGSIILAGVLAKLGTYGIVRFDLNLFPHASRVLGPLLLTLAVIGVLYGALVACAQSDLKRLVAYSSLAQIGFIALGTFALSTQGVVGAVLLMVNHGLVTAGFFLLIGWIYDRRQSWQVSELGGLQTPAPVLAGAFTVVMLASIGLPGLNGFVSEFLVLAGTFLTHRWWAVAATIGVVGAALYLLWAYQQAFHGRPGPAVAATRDLAWNERLVIAPLLVLIVLLGVYPKPVLDRITPSVTRLLDRVEQVTHVQQPPVATGGTTAAAGRGSR